MVVVSGWFYGFFVVKAFPFFLVLAVGIPQGDEDAQR